MTAEYMNLCTTDMICDWIRDYPRQVVARWQGMDIDVDILDPYTCGYCGVPIKLLAPGFKCTHCNKLACEGCRRSRTAGVEACLSLGGFGDLAPAARFLVGRECDICTGAIGRREFHTTCPSPATPPGVVSVDVCRDCWKVQGQGDAACEAVMTTIPETWFLAPNEFGVSGFGPLSKWLPLFMSGTPSSAGVSFDIMVSMDPDYHQWTGIVAVEGGRTKVARVFVPPGEVVAALSSVGTVDQGWAYVKNLLDCHGL
jgi:hypothetical protein